MRRVQEAQVPVAGGVARHQCEGDCHRRSECRACRCGRPVPPGGQQVDREQGRGELDPGRDADQRAAEPMIPIPLDPDQVEQHQSRQEHVDLAVLQVRPLRFQPDGGRGEGQCQLDRPVAGLYAPPAGRPRWQPQDQVRADRQRERGGRADQDPPGGDWQPAERGEQQGGERRVGEPQAEGEPQLIQRRPVQHRGAAGRVDGQVAERRPAPQRGQGAPGRRQHVRAGQPAGSTFHGSTFPANPP